jgi:hypothetical protein
LFKLLSFNLNIGVAQAADGITLANRPGAMLAAKKPWHPEFDQAEIQRYIASNVPESDMSFASMLQPMVVGNEHEMQNMTPSTLTALCAQTARSAIFNKFIY